MSFERATSRKNLGKGKSEKLIVGHLVRSEKVKKIEAVSHSLS